MPIQYISNRLHCDGQALPPVPGAPVEVWLREPGRIDVACEVQQQQQHQSPRPHSIYAIYTLWLEGKDDDVQWTLDRAGLSSSFRPPHLGQRWTFEEDRIHGHDERWQRRWSVPWPFAQDEVEICESHEADRLLVHHGGGQALQEMDCREMISDQASWRRVPWTEVRWCKPLPLDPLGRWIILQETQAMHLVSSTWDRLASRRLEARPIAVYVKCPAV